MNTCLCGERQVSATLTTLTFPATFDLLSVVLKSATPLVFCPLCNMSVCDFLCKTKTQGFSDFYHALISQSLHFGVSAGLKPLKMHSLTFTNTLWWTTTPLRQSWTKQQVINLLNTEKHYEYFSHCLQFRKTLCVSIQLSFTATGRISSHKISFHWQTIVFFFFLVTFSGVLYPQMRRPTKQASRFRSTARMSRPSLTNWDLVWPLVFKLLCHVSNNWYLIFSLLPSDIATSTFIYLFIISFCFFFFFWFVCLSLNPHQPMPITSVSQCPEQN